MPLAHAGEGVLVESVPASVDKAAALAAAKDALKYREWTVVAEDADSVSASIARSRIDARIRIKAQGSSLVYEESATGGRRLDHTGRYVPITTSTPSRWIDYLRSDTTERLMARAAGPREPAGAVGVPAKAEATAVQNSPSAPGGGRTSVQRLAELKEMLDRGLITAEEYARKKDEILKAL